MAVWQAYIDESRTDESLEPIVVCSSIVVATAQTWQKLIPRFVSILDKYRLPYLHATDLINGGGAFANLEYDDRVNFEKEVIAEVSKVQLIQYAFVLSGTEYNEACSEAPELNWTVFSYLYTFAIKQLTDDSVAKRNVSSVEVIIEGGAAISSSFSNEIVRMNNNVLPLKNQTILPKISKINFATDKQTCHALQLADLFACLITKNYKDHLSDSGRTKMRKDLRALLDGNQYKVFIISKDRIVDDLKSWHRYLERIRTRNYN